VVVAPGERFAAAIAKAFDELSTRDIGLVASNSGGVASGRELRVKVLDRTAVVDADAKTVRWEGGGEPEDDLKVVLLHYILGSDGRIDGRWSSFREFESGSLYYSVFQGRALVPLVSAFGTDPAKLAAASVRLGGTRVDRGDASFDFLFFPYLKVNVTLWKGDEEVPASGNILFDSAAGRFLGAEDLAHLAEEIVDMLARQPP
jgi:hypothetical protein